MKHLGNTSREYSKEFASVSNAIKRLVQFFDNNRYTAMMEMVASAGEDSRLADDNRIVVLHSNPSFCAFCANVVGG